MNRNLSGSSTTDSRYFVTDSLYLAAYLYAQGLWLSNAETYEDGTYRFAFRNGVQTEARVRQFQQAPKVMVDVRTFIYAVEELRDRATRVRRIRRD